MKIKRKHIALGFILLTIVGAMGFLNYRYRIYAINFGCGADPQYDLSIMTYNVDAYDSARFSLDSQSRLMTLLKQERPDILCLQEFSFESLKKIKPQLDSIYGGCEELQGDDQYWRLRFYSHYPLRNFKRYKCEGEIDTSDFTDEERAEVELFQKQMNTMSAEFEIEPGRWVTVFSGHLRSSAYSTARKSMDKDANWIEGISLYKRNYEVGKRNRDYEAVNVRRFVNQARTDGKPVIVAGDLNDWCGSNSLNTLMSDDLKDAWWEGGNGFGWSYFGWHLRLRLDHILFSDELELVDVKVIDSDLSDHKPLMARFRVK